VPFIQKVILMSKILLNIFTALLLMLFSAWSCADEQQSTETFRLGYYAPAFPEHSFEELEVAVKVIGEEIGKQVGIPTTVTVFNELKTLRQAFEDGQINCVLANAVILVNDFDNALFADGFKLVKYQNTFDSIVVVTRKNAGLDEFKSLLGKRLLLLEYNPIAEYYLNVLSLENFRKGYKQSFKDVIREKNRTKLC
jgi:ABC-type phosphate/phosphonate transport system substrate-binding protein